VCTSQLGKSWHLACQQQKMGTEARRGLGLGFVESVALTHSLNLEYLTQQASTQALANIHKAPDFSKSTESKASWMHGRLWPAICLHSPSHEMHGRECALTRHVCTRHVCTRHVCTRHVCTRHVCTRHVCTRHVCTHTQ
jgi:hypothetical protein